MLKPIKLYEREQVPREYLYYSFLVGVDSDARKWKYDNVRLPAKDWIHALRMYRLLINNNPKYNTITFDFSMSPVLVQKVVEFELKKTKHTQWDFKYKQMITPTF